MLLLFHSFCFGTYNVKGKYDLADFRRKRRRATDFCFDKLAKSQILFPFCIFRLTACKMWELNVDRVRINKYIGY